MDVAYIDFVRDDDASRKFFKKFGNLPSNILTIVAFSMSKGFTAYGMRMGAAIGISSDKDVAEEFYYSSNAFMQSKLGQTVIEELWLYYHK